jgi:WD40 repeat protein
MAKSAPHIYLSALPFAPTCSLVSTHYSTSFSRILHVERGQLSHWPSLEIAISNFGAVALSVAFSSDGQHIVSGSYDQAIRVWNAMTGKTAAGPFTGHTDSVFSVAFSPDGQHIVSGSDDRTIRVSNVIIRKTETTDDVDFTDRFMINDEGWRCGSKGELLMWIPSLHRKYYRHPGTIWISGKRRTILDLSDFVHGRSWATCISSQILQ